MKIDSPVKLHSLQTGRRLRSELGQVDRPGVGSSSPEFCLPLPHEGVSTRTATSKLGHSGRFWDARGTSASPPLATGNSQGLTCQPSRFAQCCY
jgi:hypothetical protein